MLYICFTPFACTPSHALLASVHWRLDLYLSIPCSTSYDQERVHTYAFKSMSNVCVCLHIIKKAICVGLWDTFLRIATHAHLGHPVMVTGRTLEQMKYLLLCFQLNSDLYKWIP